MNKSRGFTLLELMVVLVIAIMVIALIPPMISGVSSSAQLKGAARQLAAGLRSTRNRAISSQQEMVLSLDLEKRHFSISGRPRQVALPEDIALKLYTAQSELLDETKGNIRFFPDGSSTGGHITLVGKRFGYRVNVDWLTGRIQIRDQEVQ